MNAADVDPLQGCIETWSCSRALAEGFDCSLSDARQLGCLLWAQRSLRRGDGSQGRWKKLREGCGVQCEGRRHYSNILLHHTHEEEG